MENKKDSCIIFIHGLKGSAKEAKFYHFLSDKYDVIGLDYEDGDAFKMREIITSKFLELTKDYKNINVIANSIGAFYTYVFLENFNINKALFISPFVSMKEYTEESIKESNISIDEFKKEKIVKAKNGYLFSYDFYEYIKNFDTKLKAQIEVIYGDKDDLVPVSTINNFVQKTNAKLYIFNGGGHYFNTIPQLRFIKKIASEFFK